MPYLMLASNVSSFPWLPRIVVHFLHVCREVRREQGLRPLPWLTATAPVMWRKINHTSAPCLVTYTCVSVHKHELRCTCSQIKIEACGAAPGESVLRCKRNLRAFRPLSWCTLELCIHPICTPSFSLCSALQPSPQLLPENLLTACLASIHRHSKQVPLTQQTISYRK